MHLLELELTVSYANKPPVLRDLHLYVDDAEIVGLVGPSGCGKSSLACAILGLLHLKGGKVSGAIKWNGRELLSLKERAWLQLRGREIAFVPQSPAASLNPALRLRTQLMEAWKLHAKTSRSEAQEAIKRALEDVSLPASDEFLARRPAEISVGQAQRVMIAMAILHRPSLLIADEPTSALDAVTQAEILDLFSDLNRKLGMSILFISHDLLSVYSLCHRIALVHEGVVVESGSPQDIFFRPTHPFTRRLISSLPEIPSRHLPEPAFQ